MKGRQVSVTLGQLRSRFGLCASFRPLVPPRSFASPLATAAHGYATILSTGPKLEHPQLRTQHAACPWLSAGSIRCFSSDERSSGTVKMWNEERGFGFVTPADGGEDVFVHRSALGDGVQLAPGNAVTYSGVWDDRKQKYRAAGVELVAGGGGSAGDSQGQSAPRTSSSQPAQPRVLQFRSLHMVGDFAKWDPCKDPMDGAEGAPVRHRLIVRKDAPQPGGPQARGNDKPRREEFQILGDRDWDKRFYPAGGNNEEVVVLKAGEPRPAGSDKGKGHGRNWAIEGAAGTAFDIIFDPVAKTVTCEPPFSEK